MTNIYGHVSVGYVGCDRSFYICTKEEWDACTEEEQDQLFNDVLWENIDTWTSEEV